MVPEALISMLACARLGVTHSVSRGVKRSTAEDSEQSRRNRYLTKSTHCPQRVIFIIAAA